jgi:CHAD domain-containing protein
MNKNLRTGINEPIGYSVKDEAEGRRALKALESVFNTRRERMPEHDLVYFDTFDWRLYQHGLRLATCSRNGVRALKLESPELSIEATMAGRAAPTFAWRLPAGPLQELVSPILEVRRLLPLVALTTRSHGVRILDDEEKTVARVHMVHASATASKSRGTARSLAPRLRVTPVRGYPEAAERVTSYLEGELGLTRTTVKAFDEILEAVERRPAGYSSTLDLPIDGSMTAGEAVHVICRYLLDTLVANQDGVRRDLDIEFLHDFRVAARRTRSALAQLKNVFAAEAHRHFRREFKWLGSVTGPVRDLDVYLVKMDEYRASLPATMAGDLAPLAKYLRRHREAERHRLKTALGSRRYRRLLDDWRNYLDAPLPEQGLAADAHRPVTKIASQRIWRAYRRVDERGRLIDAGTPSKALHSLRIDCKKLRYLLEFFHGLYDARTIRPLIKALKQLQDNLGDFNDLEVQQATLQRFAREMHEEGLASVDCLLAMGRLRGEHEQRQKFERRRFSRCFAEFDSDRNRKRYSRLFEPPAGDAS